MLIKKPRKPLTRNQKDNIIGTGLASIHFVGFTCFTLIPLILSIVMAFCHFKPYSAQLTTMNFCGLDNFKFIFTETNAGGVVPALGSPLIWKALGNTLFMCLSIPFEILLGLVFAQLLSNQIRGKRFFRVVYYLPFVCSTVAIAYVWGYILNGNVGNVDTMEPFGLVNQIIRFFNPNAEIIEFTWSAVWIKPMVIIITIWSVLGRNLVLMESGLNNVDRRVYEAADLDGANKIQQFFKVTMPLVTPTIFYVLLTSMIGAMQSYVTMDAFVTKQYGMFGENHAGLTLVAYIMTFMSGKKDLVYINTAGETVTGISALGVACAATVFLTVIVAILTFLNKYLSKRWVHYEN